MLVNFCFAIKEKNALRTTGPKQVFSILLILPRFHLLCLKNLLSSFVLHTKAVSDTVANAYLGGSFASRHLVSFLMQLNN